MTTLFSPLAWMRVILACPCLLVAHFAVSQEITGLREPLEQTADTTNQAVVEAHRLTLARKFILFNQVLFGGDDSPHLSIRHVYDPKEIQSKVWPLNNADYDAILVQRIVETWEPAMLLPPVTTGGGILQNKNSYEVILDRPSRGAADGIYGLSDGYRVEVSERGWFVVDSNNQILSVDEGIPQLVFDLQYAIQTGALIGLDAKIDGLGYQSFLIEQPVGSIRP